MPHKICKENRMETKLCLMQRFSMFSPLFLGHRNCFQICLHFLFFQLHSLVFFSFYFLGLRACSICKCNGSEIEIHPACGYFCLCFYLYFCLFLCPSIRLFLPSLSATEVEFLVSVLVSTLLRLLSLFMQPAIGNWICGSCTISSLNQNFGAAAARGT